VARVAFALALLAGAAPLWCARQLPMVDLPQHLHLISVLHRLDDPTTLYPQVFAARDELTPYLGYYYPVSLLSWIFPLELANRLFLTAMVLGLPLATAFLLRSLGRPRWPAVLTLPFAYGDSFGWGFVNSSASFVLALLSAGLFVRALTDAPRRRRWALAQAAVLVGVVLMHVQGFLFLALALPFLLFTTRVPEDGAGRPLRPRLPAVLSTVPAVVLFGVWGAGRLLAPAEVEEGAPWKAWGPLLSERNLSFKPFRQNLDEFLDVLANLLRDGSDRWGLRAVIAVAAVAGVLWVAGRRGTPREGSLERWRLPGLAVLAGLLFLLLPFDVRGAVYYLNTRYAHLVAPLAIACLPHIAARTRPALLAAGVVAALALAIPLGTGFHAFDLEAAPLLRFAEESPPAPRIMGLIFSPGSRVVSHPVFLHAAAVPARLRGGITNFSFARTPHSPIRYRGAPPPTFPSEWRPDGFRWETMGPAYSHFLVRGVDPRSVFGPRYGTEVTPVDVAGGMGWLENHSR
jgi:biotin transporter BioY